MHQLDFDFTPLVWPSSEAIKNQSVINSVGGRVETNTPTDTASIVSQSYLTSLPQSVAAQAQKVIHKSLFSVGARKEGETGLATVPPPTAGT